MKLNLQVPLIFSLLIASALASASPVFAQTCGAGPDMTLSTSMGDMQLVIRTIPDLHLYISNQKYDFDAYTLDPGPLWVRASYRSSGFWSPPIDQLSVSVGGIGSMADKPVDLKALGEKERSFWSGTETVVGEALSDPKFLQLLSQKFGDQAQAFKENLEKLRDGYYIPNFDHSVIQMDRVVRNCGMYLKGPALVGRGYNLENPIYFDLLSVSPPGDPDPDIYLTVVDDSTGAWTLHINKQDSKNEIGKGGFLQALVAMLTSIDKYKDKLKEIHKVLEYLASQAGALEGTGFLGSDQELGLFARKALEGLEKYPVEFLPPLKIKLPSPPDQSGK